MVKTHLVLITKILRIYLYFLQIRQREASEVKNLNYIDMNSSFSTSQIQQLTTQLILRHYFLQIVSPFPLKLELKMKAANVGEIKLGGTENK